MKQFSIAAAVLLLVDWGVAASAGGPHKNAELSIFYGEGGHRHTRGTRRHVTSIAPAPATKPTDAVVDDAGDGASTAAAPAGVAAAPMAVTIAPTSAGSQGASPEGAMASPPQVPPALDDFQWAHKMEESQPMQSQGFDGRLVAHDDMSTMTSDWHHERLPAAQLCSICAKHPDNAWCRGKCEKQGGPQDILPKDILPRSGAAGMPALFAIFVLAGMA